MPLFQEFPRKKGKKRRCGFIYGECAKFCEPRAGTYKQTFLSVYDDGTRLGKCLRICQEIIRNASLQ